MFGKNIGINLKGNQQYQTKFGGVVSIGIFTVILAFCYFKVTNLILRTNPNTSFN